MSERPEYILRLRPEPGVDGPLALRHVLKRLLRSSGMKCVSVAPASGCTISGDGRNSNDLRRQCSATRSAGGGKGQDLGD